MVELTHVVTIAGPPEAVYEAVATRDGIAGWWTPRVDGSDEVGETMTMYFDRVRSFATMRVVEASAPSAVEWLGVNGDFEGITTRFALSPTSGGTHLRFSQHGWDEAGEVFGQCNYFWGFFMDSLRRYVETGRGSPR